MALTEYKVDRVRSRAASCNGLDRWIYDGILEGVDNVATLLIRLDERPSYKSFGRWKRTKVPEERTRGPLAELWGFEF
jgi:hypothetical protein